MGDSESKFGKLRLSVQGTTNGQGFDIFYDFGKSFDFVEGQSKKEFYFIQPWTQFPAKEYTDECMRVSIELVRRFNDFEQMQSHLQSATESNEIYRQQVQTLAAENERLREVIESVPKYSIDYDGSGRHTRNGAWIKTAELRKLLDQTHD